MCHESRCNTAHTSIIFSLSETQRPFLSFFLVFSFFFLFLDFIFLTLSTSFPSQTIPIMMTEVLLCSSAVLFHHYLKFSLVETGWSASKKKLLYSILQSQHRYLSVTASFESVICFQLGESLHSSFFCCRRRFGQQVKIVRNISTAKESSFPFCCQAFLFLWHERLLIFSFMLPHFCQVT